MNMQLLCANTDRQYYRDKQDYKLHTNVSKVKVNLSLCPSVVVHLYNYYSFIYLMFHWDGYE